MPVDMIDQEKVWLCIFVVDKVVGYQYIAGLNRCYFDGFSTGPLSRIAECTHQSTISITCIDPEQEASSICSVVGHIDCGSLPRSSGKYSDSLGGNSPHRSLIERAKIAQCCPVT